MSVRLLIGDVFDRLAEIPDGSVHSVITSPPYWRKRRYTDDQREIGQEPSPGEFLATLLRVTDELWRVLRDDGTIWINLGDTASGSGGAGGDYNEGGQREGQNRYIGTARAIRDAGNTYASPGEGMPLRKSVCWIPELFGASLAYGRNLLTGEACRQWITRPSVVWCKPSPTPGEILDKFREATELFVWASKQSQYYFDLDAVREEPKDTYTDRTINSSAFRGHPRERNLQTRPDRAGNPKGVPPKNWWVITSSRGADGHVAPFPEELIRRPVIASCPPGGTILDPFGGSGTTGRVATAHGRHALLIDLDPANADRAISRNGMFLEVDYGATEGAA